MKKKFSPEIQYRENSKIIFSRVIKFTWNYEKSSFNQV